MRLSALLVRLAAFLMFAGIISVLPAVAAARRCV